MSKVSKLIDVTLGIVSKRVNRKQEEEHKKVADENKKEFMRLWEEKYGKEIKGRKPLDFFEDSDKGGNDE